MNGNRFQYPARLNVLEKARTFRLDEDSLLIDEGNGSATELLPLADIAEIRLQYSPTRTALERFQCTVSTDEGKQIRLSNQYYSGFASFENRSAAYRDFVAALCRNLARVRPTARFAAGQKPLRYYLEATFVIVMFILLVAVLFALGMPKNLGSWVNLVLVAGFLLLFPWYLKRNAPGAFDPMAIPSRLLPGS